MRRKVFMILVWIFPILLVTVSPFFYRSIIHQESGASADIQYGVPFTFLTYHHIPATTTLTDTPIDEMTFAFWLRNFGETYKHSLLNILGFVLNVAIAYACWGWIVKGFRWLRQTRKKKSGNAT